MEGEGGAHAGVSRSFISLSCSTDRALGRKDAVVEFRGSIKHCQSEVVVFFFFSIFGIMFQLYENIFPKTVRLSANHVLALLLPSLRKRMSLLFLG